MPRIQEKHLKAAQQKYNKYVLDLIQHEHCNFQCQLCQQMYHSLETILCPDPACKFTICRFCNDHSGAAERHVSSKCKEPIDALPEFGEQGYSPHHHNITDTFSHIASHWVDANDSPENFPGTWDEMWEMVRRALMQCVDDG